MIENSNNGEVADRKKHRIFPCPHCANPIEITLRTEIVGVDIPDDPLKIGWRSMLTPDQLAIVELVEKSGMLKAFEDVVQRVHPPSHLPKDIARFFLTFLRSVVQKRIPTATLFQFRKAFQGTNVEFWTAQGVGVVIADKSLRAFFPLTAVFGKSIRAFGKKSGTAFQIPPDEKELSEIIRTRFGFVSGKGVFFDAMRKKSIGEFARPSL